ncbi:NAD(P)-binding protein [Myxococcus sp. K38C18041901]|uniref:NAD(P)-binding protein n=1 Tax=Myxococcus guangdongensis TaxID=2906760 RepID=UPI0020A7BD85|nr:NAD(P)-binding protein [Myxococcus guangdongensis]MCP3063990.1 NAD(P)-binding protein [Myxococcus guangdongensis]
MPVRPSYIHHDGSALMHSPLRLQQAEMYGFFVQGELSRLQATVDANLNAVASGRMPLKALSPYVLLTFTRVGHASSLHPADQRKGWITEVDIVTWILVGEMSPAGKLEHVYLYPCHIFVDDTMALVNGRELFGYPKYLCEYEMPRAGAEALRCALSVKAFQSFSPETPLASHPLLEVDATGRSGNHPPFTRLVDLLDESFALLRTLPDLFDLDRAFWAEALSLLRRPRLEQIFLKQFPDSAGVKAVYQALVVAPSVIDRFHSGRRLDHDYVCTLHALDSFPLAKTLGLKPGPQDVILPFFLHFDFTVHPGVERVDNSSVPGEKIAILGGGLGSMTAAYYLTDSPGWENRYDITVYQLGWRLGGKGASGRNPELGQRIEEHGLHIWFGFYANAFKLIQQAYAHLNRPSGAPLATWRDAFKQHDHVAVAEEVDGQWRHWPVVFPSVPGDPGEGGEELPLKQMAVLMVGWIERWIAQLRQATRVCRQSAVADGNGPGWMGSITDEVMDRVGELGVDVTLEFGTLMALVRDEVPVARSLDGIRHQVIATTLRGIRRLLHLRYGKWSRRSDDVRRLLMTLDLSLTTMKGLFEDGVIARGFDVINDIDLRDWLRKHGADESLSVDSAPVRGVYDLVFAYEGGNPDKPNAEAGTLLRSMARIGLAYKGGIMFKMQAGMGDTLFTPLYQVLKQRGVKFKFFQRVDELVPEGDTIGAIRMTEQVKLASSQQSYDPLVMVKGLECWPSQPKLDQLDPGQAALLREHQVNLESSWSHWPRLYEERFGAPLPSTVLKRGVDFDKVVYGIPVASLPILCPRLLERSPALKATAEKVQSVATQAYQVWLDRDSSRLGWPAFPLGQAPVLTAFTNPFDTWAPLDSLVEREAWPEGHVPRGVSYFCSVFPVDAYPPESDTDFPARCAAKAKQGAIQHLEQHVHALWPAAGLAGAFPWSWVVDPQDGSGPARFDRQFWRANIDPSDRYVLSVVGSSRYRLATDASGFSNLFLTGDWIKTGLNVGCVEAAVMAGMQTSRAMSGHPARIQGEHDL